jgi:hypothetical protein
MRLIICLVFSLLSLNSVAQGFFGTWYIKDIVASHVSNLTTKQAEILLGTALNYEHNKASSNESVCEKASYNSELFEESDLYNYHKVFFNDLNIPSTSTVTNIEVYCGTKPWFNIGAFLIGTSTGRYFVSYSGYVFELVRKNT